MTWFISRMQLNNLRSNRWSVDMFIFWWISLNQGSVTENINIPVIYNLKTAGNRSSGSFFRLRIGARSAVAQLVGRGEVGPEGSGQVVKLVVGTLSTELLHPAEEVWGPQVPVGHGGMHLAFVWLLYNRTTDGFTRTQCQTFAFCLPITGRRRNDALPNAKAKRSIRETTFNLYFFLIHALAVPSPSSLNKSGPQGVPSHHHHRNQILASIKGILVSRQPSWINGPLRLIWKCLIANGCHICTGLSLTELSM